MSKITYKLQPETALALGNVPSNTVAEVAAELGRINGEPLLVALDGLLRYAKAYRKNTGSDLCEDGVLGPSALEAAKSLRELLNGDGAVAWELGRSTDSKDNSSLEGVFWAFIKAGGWTESDV